MGKGRVTLWVRLPVSAAERAADTLPRSLPLVCPDVHAVAVEFVATSCPAGGQQILVLAQVKKTNGTALALLGLCWVRDLLLLLTGLLRIESLRFPEKHVDFVLLEREVAENGIGGLHFQHANHDKLKWQNMETGL